MLADGYESDIAYEFAWIFSYRTFDDIGDRKGAEEAYLHFFDNWVNQTDSAIAYAARGMFYLGVASAHRGGKFSSQTRSSQFREMREYLALTDSNFAVALEKDSGLLPVYEAQMSSATKRGEDSLVQEVMEKALVVAPSSYWIRAAYLHDLKPQWGGSYEEMQVYLDSLTSIYDTNPRLWRLQGEAAGNRARRAYRNDEYEMAVQYISEALEYGDKYTWLKDRAFFNYKLKRYNESIADLKRIAGYGGGVEGTEFLIHYLTKAKESSPEAKYELPWTSFLFPT